MSANDENKIMSSVSMDNSDAKADAVAGGNGGNGGDNGRGPILHSTRASSGVFPEGEHRAEKDDKDEKEVYS